MTDAELARYVAEEFEAELAEDLAFERAISRRCLYAVAIVIAIVVARHLWFV